MVRDEDFRVYILNPAHAELLHLATNFTLRGIDFTYFAALTFGADSRLSSLAKKRYLPPKIKYLLSKRIVSLKEKNISRGGILWDILFVFSKRFFTPADSILIFFRNRGIERKALRCMSRDNPNLVISQHTLGFRIFEETRKRGIVSVLNYSIAHQLWADNILTSESESNPDWSDFESLGFLDRLISKIYLKEIELSDKILVGSDFVYRTFMESGVDPSKVIVSNYGASVSEFGIAKDYSYLQRVERKPSAPINIVFVGQVIQRKGIRYLVEAFNSATLPKNSKLWIVGPITSRTLKRKLSLYQNVNLLGKLSKKEIFLRVKESDIFILPSLVEGFALSAIEAMSLAIPVVLSTNTGVADIIENGIDGYVVNVQDSATIVEIINFAVLNPKTIAHVGYLGYEKSKLFDWTTYENRTYEILKNLI